MTPADHELLACIRRRHNDAFETLMARYRDSVLRHLRSIVREQNAAEDLLQEVFLRVWTRAEQWNGAGTVRAWLFRIATNLALNHLRTLRRRRESPLGRSANDFMEEDETPLPAWMVDSAALRPEQQMERNEREERLWELVKALPEEKRDVFRLVHEDDLDLRDVAEILDIPEGTAKSRLYHARKRLARQWHAFENEGEDSR